MATVWGVDVGAEQWGPFPSKAAAEEHGAARAAEMEADTGHAPDTTVWSATQPDPPGPRGGVR